MSRLSRIFSGFILTVFLSLGAWAENTAHVQQAYQTGSCPSCDLSSAYLKGLQALEGDLSYASLQGANLTMAQLQSASFVGADLTAADLSGADLSFADFSGSTLAGVVTDENTICPIGGTGPCSF